MARAYLPAKRFTLWWDGDLGHVEPWRQLDLFERRRALTLCGRGLELPLTGEVKAASDWGSYTTAGWCTVCRRRAWAGGYILPSPAQA